MKSIQDAILEAVPMNGQTVSYGTIWRRVRKSRAPRNDVNEAIAGLIGSRHFEKVQARLRRIR